MNIIGTLTAYMFGGGYEKTDWGITIWHILFNPLTWVVVGFWIGLILIIRHYETEGGEEEEEVDEEEEDLVLLVYDDAEILDEEPA